MTILRETRAFCPECLEKLPARVVKEADGVYLLRV